MLVTDVAAQLPTPRRLSRESILEVTHTLLEQSGAHGVTMRRIGVALDAHPTAVYRHFRDKDELLRAAADLILEPIGADLVDSVSDPLVTVSGLIMSLREVLLAHPAAAAVMAPGPSRKYHESLFTERLLHLLRASGLPDDETVLAYHALVEYAVGSATIDAMTTDEDREVVYRTWRADYLSLPADVYPNSTELAVRLYPAAESQFAFGLDLMISALRVRTKGG